MPLLAEEERDDLPLVNALRHETSSAPAVFGFAKLPCLLHHHTDGRVGWERTMEFRFYCPSCGQKLKAEEEHAGWTVD